MGSVRYCGHGLHHSGAGSGVCVGVVCKVKIVVSCHNCYSSIVLPDVSCMPYRHLLHDTLQVQRYRYANI